MTIVQIPAAQSSFNTTTTTTTPTLKQMLMSPQKI